MQFSSMLKKPIFSHQQKTSLWFERFVLEGWGKIA